MVNLTQAHQELYRRSPDECFPSLTALWEHCKEQKESSVDRWHLPQVLQPRATSSGVSLSASDGTFQLNDWSFTQLCKLAGVSKDTLNRLSPETASRALCETLPVGQKPLQLLTSGELIRSIHGPAYTRLWNLDLLHLIREFATDFQPPQKAAGSTGGTGLYAGEQDLFCFMIDPLGWTEIESEAFAPGFFVWNSEVGKRSIGMSMFWFQAVCQNHIVWGAVDIIDLTRKHTSSVHEVLGDMRRAIEALVAKRDARKDGFVQVIRNAMQKTLGEDADEAIKAILSAGIPRSIAREALEIARQKGRFTIWAVVDALTRLALKVEYAGDRTDANQKAAALLALAA